MSHDVIKDRYARLYELPFQLVNLGNTLQCVCLSYQGEETQQLTHAVGDKSQLPWHSFNSGPMLIGGFPGYFTKVKKLVQEFKPNILIGSSDCLHVILTAAYAKLFKVPYVIDLYDNYASFGMAKIPGVLPVYHWALGHADGICCVSEPLSLYIRQQYKCARVLTLESTINLADFAPMDQTQVRLKLGLPVAAKIIGVAGSLNTERGINLLYGSFLSLAEKNPHLHLALAGPVDPGSPVPDHPRIHYLGLLPHKDIKYFYNALDLAVLCMRDTEFGRYAFPQKTYEILACKTPILTAKLGALQVTFKDYPQCLYEPDNLVDLQHKIESLLHKPITVDISIPSWCTQAEKLNGWLNSLLLDKGQ